MTDRVYLDYNASAPLLPEAREAVIETMDAVGNPSSVHRDGREARRIIEQARGHLADALGVGSGSVIFTSGATEANILALSGTGRSTVLASAIEHDSVLSTPGVETFAVTSDGVADLSDIEHRLASVEAKAIVSLQMVNNETGVIQPVADAAHLARASGALIHCDAVQALGRIPLSPDQLGVDLVTVSGHKIGGPKGVGALISRDGLPITPLITGGGQERRRRAGTENVTAIAGFGAAAKAANIGKWSIVAEQRDRLEAKLRDLPSRVQILGVSAERVANTVCVAMPGVDAETQLMAFDLAGIAVSAGSACSSGKVATSHVLAAMGVPKDTARCAIRVSLGPATKADEIDRFVAAWRQISARRNERERAVA
ncbi:MAG: cysteine desulfurase family protein [Pseudomonadota bacterium]